MRILATAALVAACALPTLAGAVQTDPGPPVQASGPAVPAPPENEHRTRDVLHSVGLAWFKGEWKAYKARFVSGDGRVVDNANGNVSHSEGQGYGLLLAAMANDEAGFRTIWGWTRANLMVRPDGLAAWKWSPAEGRAVDLNNATDGDILIAWALAEAGRRFADPALTAAAKPIAEAIGATLIAPSPMGPVLLPGAEGFKAPAQRDGPVVNPSYYVFPAFDDLKRLAPGADWDGLRETGRRLIKASRFGPMRLPSDWVALGTGTPAPASGFPRQFGYNAIRIPLYLAWAGRPEADGIGAFAGLWNRAANVGPFVIDVSTGSAVGALDGTGYRLVASLVACASRNQPIPDGLTGRRDGQYYAETLRLFSMSVIEERYPQCL